MDAQILDTKLPAVSTRLLFYLYLIPFSPSPFSNLLAPLFILDDRCLFLNGFLPVLLIFSGRGASNLSEKISILRRNGNDTRAVQFWSSGIKRDLRDVYAIFRRIVINVDEQLSRTHGGVNTKTS